MQEKPSASWGQFFWRITACHMVTYFIMGLLASTLLDYKNFFGTEILVTYMRQIESPWVAAGPALQVFRGLLFALVLWPIRDSFLEEKKGWLRLWLLFIGLAILGTAGPSPGSLEGIVYTQLPIEYHLWGLPEVIIQTLLFSLAVVFWYKKPSKAWNIIMAIFVALIVLMGLAGVFIR
ncbi:MAG: hypothetical protein GX085_07880 [Firmicutes bacterium]|nr:hypothetical protein [Bacillota bacterium]